jgi:hypothetical protein
MDEAGIGRQVGRGRSSGDGDGIIGARHVDSGDGNGIESGVVGVV